MNHFVNGQSKALEAIRNKARFVGIKIENGYGNDMSAATVIGKDGKRYQVNTKGLTSDDEILKAAEKYYQKPMDKILEKH